MLDVKIFWNNEFQVNYSKNLMRLDFTKPKILLDHEPFLERYFVNG